MHFTAIFNIAREYCAIKSAMMIAIDLCAISIANLLRSMFVLIITQINSPPKLRPSHSFNLWFDVSPFRFLFVVLKHTHTLTHTYTHLHKQTNEQIWKKNAITILNYLNQLNSVTIIFYYITKLFRF